MALLHKLTKELHKEFWESGALALNRDQTVSLLELLAEVAGQVDHLTCHQGRTIDQNGREVPPARPQTNTERLMAKNGGS
jgi:hypothetical protein